ncbi:MAG TPA: choice-of-anchor tandem repeat GloVer-containing protein [Terriglobales bacterium]|nr:choice-of-anchor tandem repeat GloVer-containing protein [Terriglobales bacterium]
MKNLTIDFSGYGGHTLFLGKVGSMRKRSVLKIKPLVLLVWMGLCIPFQVWGQSAKESVLYAFGTNGKANDGYNPNGALVFDQAGNIYGTTFAGGTNCQSLTSRCGTLFELSPLAGGGWNETVLYNFCQSGLPNCVDGAVPQSGLLMDSSGNLYGTTSAGGTGSCSGGNTNGCGTVFELSPIAGGWAYQVLYSFGGNATQDGCLPTYATLIMDESGTLYGTTTGCGVYSRGIAFELSPPLMQGGEWTETVLYSFCQENNCSDGAEPSGGMVLDNAGNLFGTTYIGAVDDAGVLYELSPQMNGEWKESVIYKFSSKSGGGSLSGLSIDPDGNLYGTLFTGGTKNGACDVDSGSYCGGVFRFSTHTGKEISFLFNGSNGANPMAGVVVDGNTVFGTTFLGNNVFRIQGTNESVLYKFCSRPNCVDGSVPSPGSLTTTLGGSLEQLRLAGDIILVLSLRFISPVPRFAPLS